MCGFAAKATRAVPLWRTSSVERRTSCASTQSSCDERIPRSQCGCGKKTSFVRAGDQAMSGFVVRDSIRVAAPMERCFLLSTSIDLVQGTLGMRPSPAESKKITGLVEAEDQLVWRGWKFGLPAMHETLITAYDPPTHFQDTMGRGRFAAFQHDHWFQPYEDPGGTENNRAPRRSPVQHAARLGRRPGGADGSWCRTCDRSCGDGLLS